jgi:hypothetical protein
MLDPDPYPDPDSMNPDPNTAMQPSLLHFFVTGTWLLHYRIYLLANDADLRGLPGLPGHVSPVCGEVPTGGGHAAQGARPRHRSFYACLNYN